MMREFTAILGYHKVGPENEEGRWLNVSPDSLRSQVRFLKRRNFRFLQVAGLASIPGGRNVVLTFDDAYESFLTHGVEVLAQEQVTGSTYVVSDLVGQTSSWDGEKARPLGDWSLIQSAARLGIEIGNHTASHCRLADLSREEQAAEIARGHEALVAQGIVPQSFCLPYGSYSDTTIDLVREAGYQVNLTVERGLVSTQSDPLRLPRVMVSFSDRVPGLWYKLFVKPIIQMQKSRT